MGAFNTTQEQYEAESVSKVIKKGNSVLTKRGIFDINDMHTNNTNLRKMTLVLLKTSQVEQVLIQTQISAARNIFLLLLTSASLVLKAV